MRIPAKAASDSDGKHPLIPTQSIQVVGAQRRWGDDHFRSGWLRSNRNGIFPKVLILSVGVEKIGPDVGLVRKHILDSGW